MSPLAPAGHHAQPKCGVPWSGASVHPGASGSPAQVESEPVLTLPEPAVLKTTLAPNSPRCSPTQLFPAWAAGVFFWGHRS